MSKDKQLSFENSENKKSSKSVEAFEFKQPIRGFPELQWRGKRPFTSTQYFPAQLKENYGKSTDDGWMNKIFWGDNLQVMSHLLKEFRGKIDLIYIDPPFDSKADYKKEVKLKGKSANSDQSVFEEKQYTDIWTNDDYLQFMYERLILMRELLSDSGSIYLHCDWHKNHHLRCIMDEVFGADMFRNEVIWSYFGFKRATAKKFPQKHDTIISYSKSKDYKWNVQFVPHSQEYISRFKKDKNGRLFRDDVNPTGGGARVIYLDEVQGDIVDSTWEDIPPVDIENNLIHDYWDDIPPVNPVAKDRQNYPTQKPVKLAERILLSATSPGDLVFDCFMGSGTLPAAAIKTGRRFIGADINLGAIQVTSKRLAKNIGEKNAAGFSVYNVNNYDLFRNPVEAKEVLLSALEIVKISNTVFDGEKDGRMVKIMPVNRIASKSDLNDLISGFDYKSFEKRQSENPNKAVEKILLVCMGHEPDLKAHLEKEVNYKLDIEIVDILRDKQDLQFKRESEAKIKIKKDKLVIEKFFPMNLLQKLSVQKDNVKDWKELVESVLIDWNYDGAVLEPQVIDIPEKEEFVKGEYDVPKDAGTIRVKITDLLSESIEVEVKRD